MRVIQGLSSEFSKLDEDIKGVFLACCIALYMSVLFFAICNIVVYFSK